MKSQNVRLVDIWLLAPFMIWAGATKMKGVPQLIMIGSGVLTGVYNWDNYLKIKRIES